MKKFLARLFGFLSVTHVSIHDDLDDQFLIPFGYKRSWYVIHENELAKQHLSIQDLANLLNIQQQQILNWNTGFTWLRKQYQYYDKNPEIFLTPNLNGYHYIITRVSEKLDLLDNKIANYFAFTSYRVADAVAWKVVKNHQVTRYFSYADSQIFYNEGKQTQAEKQLGLADITGLSEEQAIDKIFAEFEQYDKNPDYLMMIDEETPAKLQEVLTGQNPVNFGKLSIDKARGEGIIGFLSKT